MSLELSHMSISLSLSFKPYQEIGNFKMTDEGLRCQRQGIKQGGVSKCLPITMKRRKLFVILEYG